MYILSSAKSDPGTGLLRSSECSNHVTTFETFVRIFESLLCRCSNIRVKVIDRSTRTNSELTEEVSKNFLKPSIMGQYVSLSNRFRTQ